jgi:flavin reductase (DIM6/NTAB) family NADH-FMN oxidoreductase RutF
MTINSLVSVSLDPMLVSWNLQNSASQFAAYAEAERFTISILAHGQQALARRYAARGASGLMAEDFELGEGGLPVIRGALGHVTCRRFAMHGAGDHTLILGEVTGLAQGNASGPAPAPATDDLHDRPLLFFGGRFGELAG